METRVPYKRRASFEARFFYVYRAIQSRKGGETDVAQFIFGAEVRPNNRAKCQVCNQPIRKDSICMWITGYHLNTGYMHFNCLHEIYAHRIIQRGKEERRATSQQKSA